MILKIGLQMQFKLALAIMRDILDAQIFVTWLINYWELTVKIIIYSKIGN